MYSRTGMHLALVFLHSPYKSLSDEPARRHLRRVGLTLAHIDQAVVHAGAVDCRVSVLHSLQHIAAVGCAAVLGLHHNAPVLYLLPSHRIVLLVCRLLHVLCLLRRSRVHVGELQSTLVLSATVAVAE